MRVKLIGTALATGLSAFALAACGGDDDGGGDGGEASVEAFCETIEGARAAEDPFEGLEPGDTEGVVDAFGSARDQIRDVADAAPDEVRDDAEQLASAFDDLVSSAEGADSEEALRGVLDDFNQRSEELADTTQRLEEYTNENCGAEEEQEDPAGEG
jgi:hypothetical protein